MLMASKTTTSATESAKAKETVIPDMNTFYNELVSVKLFKDNGRYKEDVFVAVNGVGMLVPRGIEVKIPRKYALALKNSEKQTGFALEYQNRLQNESAIAD